MLAESCTLLFEPDPALRASLIFALGLQGFRLLDGNQAEGQEHHASCLVIDQRAGAAGALSLLVQLRLNGCLAPAIILATHPPPIFRQQVEQAGAVLIEKPLFGDALSGVLGTILCRDA